MQGHPGKNDETNWVRQIDEKKPKVLARGTAMPLTNTDFENIENRTAPRFSKLPTVLEEHCTALHDSTSSTKRPKNDKV